MSDQQNGRQNAAGSPADRPQPTAGMHNRVGSANHGANATNQADGPKLKRHALDIVGWTAWLTVATAILAVVGIGTFFVAIRQLHEMRSQLGAMNGQLIEMQKANEKTERAITAATRQATAAETANGISQSALVSSDRPWLYPIITPFVLPQQGQEIRINVITSNTGRSPATNATQKIELRLNPDNDSGPDVPQCDFCSEFVVAPSSALNGASFLSGNTVTQAVIDDILAQRKFLFVLARVDYKDTSGKDHQSTLCNVFAPDTRRFTSCDRAGSNSAD